MARSAHDPRTDPDVPTGMSVELLQDLHLLTRDGQLNADARRKLKQIRHLVGLLKPALDDALARIRKFKPEALVVSLGLDIAKADPTGTWSVTRAGLFEIGQRIGGLRLPTLLVQEGGYNVRFLGRNAASLLTGVCAGALGRRTRKRPTPRP